MQTMKANKAALWFGALLVFGAVVLGVNVAKADNWIESSDGYWYNSEYTFVDRGTNLVIVEVGLDNDDGSFDYDLVGIDCNVWYFHVLNEVSSSRNYVLYPDWKTAPDLYYEIPPGSKIDNLAGRVCPGRYNLPYGDVR
ncbi:MAG: hypothetical protein ACTSU8_06335 [Alphaproteobacteria bacterium]